MKIKNPNKQEKMFYEVLDRSRNLSVSAIDELIVKLTEPRLVSLAMWMKDCKLHMEET
jgi:hypothetical protein